MNDATSTPTAPDTTGMVAAATMADPLAEQRKTVNAIRRATFTPEQLADATVTAQLSGILSAVSACGLTVVNNHDATLPIPEGFNLAIIPVPKNKGEGASREVVGMVVGVVPSFDATMGTDGGAKFIADAIASVHLNKLANASRKVIVDGKTTAIPASVLDFITNQRATESMDGFNSVHVKVMALLAKSLRGLNKRMLRDCLAIAAYAEQQYPAVAQEKWVGVLDSMLRECERKGIDPGVMATWKLTRDAAAADTGDFDLAGLDGAFDDDDDGNGDDADDSPDVTPVMGAVSPAE